MRLVDATTFEEEPVQLGGVPEQAWPFRPHYSADGRFLAVGFEGFDGEGRSTGVTSALVWNLASPAEPVLRLDVPGYDVELNADGSVLYVGALFPPTVTAYEVPTGRPLGSAEVPGPLLELSEDGALLAASGGNDVVLLDAATLAVNHRLQGHAEWVEALAFSADGTRLASGSDDRTVSLWDTSTGERREVLRGHASGVWGVGFNPAGETLYTSSGPTWLTWDLTGDRRFVARRPIEEPTTLLAEYAVSSPTGHAVAYLSTSVEADTGGPVALLQFLDLGETKVGAVIDTGHGRFGTGAWRPDGSRFATAGADGAVRVWDWRDGTLIAERQVAPGHIAGLAYTGDGRRLVVAERAGSVYTIDAETLEVDGPASTVDKRIFAVYASPDNRTAIAMTEHGFAVIDLDDGGVIHEGAAGFAPYVGDFSPDGQRFVVTGFLGEVRLLDVASGRVAGAAGEVRRRRPTWRSRLTGPRSPPEPTTARSDCGTVIPAPG